MDTPRLSFLNFVKMNHEMMGLHFYLHIFLGHWCLITAESRIHEFILLFFILECYLFAVI